MFHAELRELPLDDPVDVAVELCPQRPAGEPAQAREPRRQDLVDVAVETHRRLTGDRRPAAAKKGGEADRGGRDTAFGQRQRTHPHRNDPAGPGKQTGPRPRRRRAGQQERTARGCEDRRRPAGSHSTTMAAVATHRPGSAWRPPQPVLRDDHKLSTRHSRHVITTRRRRGRYADSACGCTPRRSGTWKPTHGSAHALVSRPPCAAARAI